MGRGFEHRPVMVDEIVDVFSGVPSGTVVDATLGGGGHSAALLE
ncbi:MAG: 16S rRNA (cytosine(1402)-N(4))-methyltransferase, partial [Actinomycetota bacterium]